MTDQIAEIRERHERDSRYGDGLYPGAHRDRATLLAEIERLREALSWYADQRNHFPVERRNPGDPDPAVIFLEEPPIMSDGGKRARNALEGKP